MTLTPQMIGAAIGLLIGLFDFFIFMRLSRNPVRRGSALPVRFAGAIAVVAFPIVGWFAGPYVADMLKVPS